MNKAELVEEVANQTGLVKKTSRQAVHAMTSVISDALARGEKVTLVGFGAFQVMERKARRDSQVCDARQARLELAKVPDLYRHVYLYCYLRFIIFSASFIIAL